MTLANNPGKIIAVKDRMRSSSDMKPEIRIHCVTEKAIVKKTKRMNTILTRICSLSFGVIFFAILIAPRDILLSLTP